MHEVISKDWNFEIMHFGNIGKNKQKRTTKDLKHIFFPTDKA